MLLDLFQNGIERNLFAEVRKALLTDHVRAKELYRIRHDFLIYMLAFFHFGDFQVICLVTHAESALIDAGCPKIDLMVRKTNDEVISFCQSISSKRQSAIN